MSDDIFDISLMEKAQIDLKWKDYNLAGDLGFSECEDCDKWFFIPPFWERFNICPGCWSANHSDCEALCLI